MTVLRNFIEDDIPILRENGYGDLSCQAMGELIGRWNEKNCEGKYFEMFAITDGPRVVGCVSLHQKTRSVASCGVEIFAQYRRKGYAFCAVSKAMEIARDRGYAIMLNQVRTDNAASIALQKKLGFEMDGYEYKNRKGNSVYLCLKSLI